MKKQCAIVLFVVCTWQIVSILRIINPMFLPSPLEVIQEAGVLIHNKTILFDILSSIGRIIVGVSISIIIGVPIGLMLGYSARIYTYLNCLIDFLRSIPPIVTFPLFLLIFGIGEPSRIAVIVFGCSTIIILNSAMGIHNSSKMRINYAKVIGAKRYQIFFNVLLFDASPQVFVGIRVALSMGIIIGIVTEMLVGAQFGLGSRAIYAQTAYNTPELFVIIITIGLIGFLINKILILIENNLIHWRAKT